MFILHSFVTQTYLLTLIYVFNNITLLKKQTIPFVEGSVVDDHHAVVVIHDHAVVVQPDQGVVV